MRLLENARGCDANVFNHAHMIRTLELAWCSGCRHAVALKLIIHELKLLQFGSIMFAVFTDQHSIAISVQAVDDIQCRIPSMELSSEPIH